MQNPDSVIRFERHFKWLGAVVLFCLGAYGLTVLPSTFKEWVVAKAEVPPKTVRAIQVFMEREGPIGWLFVNYQDSMSMNEEAPLNIAYRTVGRSWSGTGGRVLEHAKMGVTIS